MPGDRHAWPIAAACWSPAQPGDRRSARPAIVAVPSAPAQSVIAGSAPRRNAEARRSAPRPSAHVARSISSVRDAFVASVAWTAPPVSLYSSQLSTVPSISVPAPPRVAHRRPVGQRPDDLRRREIRDRAPARSSPAPPARAPRRASASHRSVAAPVLPDDRRRQRLAGRAVPEHDRLALVGDAEAGDPLDPDRGGDLVETVAAQRPQIRRRRARPSRSPGNAA